MRFEICFQKAIYMITKGKYTNKGKQLFILSFLLLFAVSSLSAQIKEQKEIKIDEDLSAIKRNIERQKSEDFAEKIEGTDSKSKIADEKIIEESNTNPESKITSNEVIIDKTIFEKKSFGSIEFKPPSIFGRKNERKDNSKTLETIDIENGIDWKSAFNQSFLFLGIQHGYAVTQSKTRRALKGKFFKDYVDSVKSLHGWEDGGRFFTNYIAHPMQGSFTGFILVQNDRKGRQTEFGKSKEYWNSRLKALAWSAAWSTQFEIGPISQASIGNVGLSGKQTYVDIVITPTVGFGMMISEDALDKYLIKRIERNIDNYYVKIFSRMLFNPTRTMANLVRFKLPWYRDNR